MNHTYTAMKLQLHTGSKQTVMKLGMFDNVFWAFKMQLGQFFFKIQTQKDEVLYNPIGLWAAELPALKVCLLRESCLA